MDNFHQVPHLTTALIGPLEAVEKAFLNNQTRIEGWFREQWQNTRAPMQSSVDIRNAGFKIAPVDTNLFPAGVNNLNPDFIPLCIQAVQNTLSQHYPGCKRILIIPESHTRNLFYYENLAMLQNIYQKAGYEVRLGSLLSALRQAKDVTLASGRTITLEPVTRTDNKIGVEGYEPCIILLNNDFSEGVPELLSGIEQPIIPALELGWSHRLKSNHFSHYSALAKKLATLLDLDPWLISPLFRHCENVDFVHYEGEDCMVSRAEEVLQEVQKKYDEYGIKQAPFVVVKADAGTYGMGVLMIKDPEEIRKLNRKQRAHMAATKGNQEVNKVIIQEGVYTFETWGDEEKVAEPVVYMFGQHVVGGFYRVHTKKGVDENLNSPGMSFEPLAFAQSCNNPDKNLPAQEQHNRFYAYGVIGRLAALAAAKEMEALGE